MRTNFSKLRSIASAALAVCSCWLAAHRADAQTFDTVLNTNLFQPSSVSVSTLNHYIISDTADHRIVDFNVDNRTFLVLAGPDRAPFEPGAVDGQGTDARFRNPQGVLCAGDITYVADSGNHLIRAIDKNGNVRTIAGNVAQAHEVDDFGGSPMNWGFTDATGANAQFNGPSGLAWDGNNQLFIADSGNHAVRVLDLTSGAVTTLVRSGLTTPVAVALGPNGTLFISDIGAHSIKIWHPGDTKATLLAGGGSPLARGFRNSAIGTNALFSAPAGIFYRESTDELIVADSGNGVLRTIQGAATGAPKVDTCANTTAAGFQSPVGVTRDLYGVFLVCDPTRNTLASVLTVRLPRIERPQVGYIDIYIDQQTGLPVAHLIPVTDATFENDVKIAVSGDAQAQHYFTVGASLTNTPDLQIPTTNSTSAPNFVQPVEPAPPDNILRAQSINGIYPAKYNFHLKVFSAPKGNDERIASLMTEAYFRFKCASPQIDSQSVPGRLVFHCNTTNAVMYYTLDGSDPAPGVSGAQLIRNNDSIALIVTTNTLTIRARAFLNDHFLPSETTQVTFSPDNFVPNRISLGFSDGEASSMMHAAPGQRYFAPVTLSLMPGAKAYGLQFDLSLQPLGKPLAGDYKMKFSSSFIEQTDFTNRVIPPSVFVLTGTNFVTNLVDKISTNFTYEVTFTNVSSLPSTNYVLFTNELPKVSPVVSTIFATNLGTIFPVSITNYVTNSFQLVSNDIITKTNIDVETNYLYRYVSPSVTNVVRVDAELPASSPVVVTNFVSNLGQLYSYNITNFITNSFNLVSKNVTTTTNETTTTNYIYQAVTPATTNYLALNQDVPPTADVIVTNFVSNLGQLFPVTTTNHLTNAFDFITSAVFTTNIVTFETNYLYRAVTPGVSNYVILDHALLNETPVVVTNFVTNMGQLFPFTTTNYVTNQLNFISSSVVTTTNRDVRTNFLYEVGTPTHTDLVVLDHALLDKTAVITTNFVSNLGQQFPVLTTNYISNSFNVRSIDVRTNDDPTIITNFTYQTVTPGTTNLLTVNAVLPPVVPVITTNQISNLGQLFPVVQTNYLSNRFDLVSSAVTSSRVSNVSTSFVYRYISAPPTNYITIDHFFPDPGPVVTFLTATNLGQTYVLSTTNIVPSVFEFVSADIKTNVLNQLSYEYTYDDIPWTNSLLMTTPLPDPSVVITTNSILVTNQTTGALVTFKVNTTNTVTSADLSLVFHDGQVEYLYSIPSLLAADKLVSSIPLSFPTNIAIQNTGYIPTIDQTFTEQFVTVIPNVVTSTNTNTLASITVSTNVTYALRFPVQTNYLTLSTNLPDVAPVLSQLILTNQGQNFTFTVTNYVTNRFELVSATFTTNTVTNVVTNSVYALRTPPLTNYINVPTNLPASAPIVTTSFITNLGQLFPVTTTNYVANTFDFVRETHTTNHSPTITTNVVYEFTTPGSTNYLFLTQRLPDTAPVITTNFVSNLGQLFPITVTNYLTNSFRLVSDAFVSTNETSTVSTQVVYLFATANTTNYLNLAEKLPPSRSVITTNFISNLGQSYPVLTTNIVLNTFDFLGSSIASNVTTTTVSNLIYALKTPSVTNIVFWPVKLPDSVTLISTNFITNLGSLFPVLSTNIVPNTFQLLGTRVDTSRTFDVRTNIYYEFHSPGLTNFFELDEILPAFVQVITTNFVTNLGRAFPVMTTNLQENLFDLISTNVAMSTNMDITTNFLYSVVTPGGGPGGQSSVTTNLLTLDSQLPLTVPIVSFLGYATNLDQLYPVYSTNYVTNTFRLVSTTFTTNSTEVALTNVPDAFTDLVITNYTQNWLAVGWVETYGRTNLYNTIQHDLLNLSMPHTTTFVSKNGEAVPGSFSFIVPTNSSAGDQYKLQVSRPSATADGISQDMFIEAPDDTDTHSPVKAVKTLTVTNMLGYLAGDVSNFRWFNAGEFGDTNILNNDITELQRVIVYGLNVPPEDSDFLDAMDTCCFTEDGVDLSNIEFASSSIDINKIAFGEGSRYAPLGRRPNATLAVNDLYVAFRRSLDPDLNWYWRYWSNGMRQATIIPNSFRGKTGRPAGVSAIKPYAVQTTVASTAAPALTLYAGTASGLPGKVVAVPIHARVDGSYPLRTLMFNVRVEAADGTIVPGSSLEVLPDDALGVPKAIYNDVPGISAAAWYDGLASGFVGDQVIGRVLFTIPDNAQPMNLYYVKLANVSGSPNGVSLFPVRSGNGLVAMANRPTIAWNDGIPDAWRMRYFGTLNDPRSAADVDADGDGLSNYEEFMLGTNPVDPSDSLRLHAASNGRGVMLRFHTANGKLYLIEGSSSLQPGSWSPVLMNVPGTGKDIELPSPGGDHFFYYRVRLQE